ncbi:MAG: hypothetical protein CM15mP103_06640 [Gammaproteobacteria bacterium]|nr:MAG: hypothetical protein CM15mP103_06640 [Gammaproteobacteria bacterium]
MAHRCHRYSLTAYVVGWWLLFSGGWAGFIPGVLLLGHGMIIAAYMIHECAHNTVFTVNRHNNQLAGWLGWISRILLARWRTSAPSTSGITSRMTTWCGLITRVFQKHPLVYRITIFLEWCFIPAHCILMHTIMVFTAFIIPRP